MYYDGDWQDDSEGDVRCSDCDNYPATSECSKFNNTLSDFHVQLLSNMCYEHRDHISNRYWRLQNFPLHIHFVLSDAHLQ